MTPYNVTVPKGQGAKKWLYGDRPRFLFRDGGYYWLLAWWLRPGRTRTMWIGPYSTLREAYLRTRLGPC